MTTREAAAAGRFYPSNKEELAQQINGFLKQGKTQEKANCVIAPHAGYEYSGKTAGYAFNALKESKCFVILGPNHTGLGNEISISGSDFWETPLGKIQVNNELRKKLLTKLGIEADDLAHIDEHSIEVQLPFLQSLFQNFTILPITIMEHRLYELEKLGKALANIGQEFSLIISSDFTHQEPLETVKEKDMKAIELVEKLNGAGFHKMVLEKRLSICGFAPITAGISYCKEKGMSKGTLLKYDTSATASGNKESVVGYAAIKFE